MKAVILAAGEGSRLRPFTYTQPKGMVPVANKPILEYIIRALAENGIRNLVIVVGYKKERIIDYFEDGERFGVSIEYVVQNRQLGTGHALIEAQKLLDEEFVLLPGDNIISAATIGDLLAGVTDTAAMLIKRHNDISKYGAVEVRNNTIVAVREKPRERVGGLISTGIAMLNPSVFESLLQCLAEGITGFPEMVNHLIDMGTKVTPVITKNTWIDVVYPWDLLSSNEAAMTHSASHHAGKIEKNVTIRGPVHIGENTIIRAGAYIVGPVIIGDGCDIGPMTCIFPSTTIGDNVTIRAFSEITNSVVMENARIGTGCVLADSVIGTGTTLSPHFVSDAASAQVRINGKLYAVERIGAIIGEDTTIGSNVSVEPGIIIGSHCRVASSKRIFTNVGDRSVLL